MTQDPEIDAMAKVSAALTDLDDKQQTRVVTWAAQRFGLAPAPPPPGPSSSGSDSAGRRDDAFTDFAQLYDAADPTGEQNRTLVSSYWFQVVQGAAEIDAQTVHNALKDMGGEIANITKVMGRLQAKKPAFVRQVRKSGKAKQARKMYRLTGAGIKAVEAMLKTDARSDSDGGASK